VSPAVPASPLPTKSRIRNWQSAHLDAAASQWRASAKQSEDLFEQHRQNIAAPGGTEWVGEAKDAAWHRVSTDLGVVRRQGDVQREAADIAERGANDIRGAQRATLDAIADAETDGFKVGEDLSVIDTRRFDLATAAARHTAATEHAEYIRWNAEQLIQTDTLIGKQLNAKAAELEGILFDGESSDSVIQAVDFKQAPPPPPYPVNEVIAEATDLDGNHVVLRRGYYDESTQQGFGWDKAYWRHHVVNPNVFKDLISHSRPKSNDGGTVVYDVPINRVHCTEGFLGIPDCEDTGESVTMRIVANINEGNPAVPDGGQKGVITMYPLEGGSGVVELEPGWTLTPPWVNNNVPIN
jgi:hypothetical protein